MPADRNNQQNSDQKLGGAISHFTNSYVRGPDGQIVPDKVRHNDEWARINFTSFSANGIAQSGNGMKILLSIVLALVALTNSFAGEIRVSAAASLTDALKEIAAAHEKQTGDKI